MELKLAQNERIIKSWDYAEGGHTLERNKDHSNLTVTNLRVVSTTASNISLKRKEIPLKDVRSVEGEFKKNDSFWAKLQLFFGIILCVVIIGIPIVIKALKKLRACTFQLKFMTTINELPSCDLLAIGAKAAADAVGRRHFFAKPGSINAYRVSIDKKLAQEILDEIGAVIVDAKA